MALKKDGNEDQGFTTDHTKGKDNGQLNPLADFKKPVKKKKGKRKKKGGDENGSGPMGFDEWSVSWP